MFTGFVTLLPSMALFIGLFLFQGMPPHGAKCAGNFGPVTYVHRGNLNHAQENTYDSVVTGAAMNGLNPEIDVSVVKDGEAVLFHDISMKRMSGVEKDLKDVPFDEVMNTTILQTIDGYDYNFTNEIPMAETIITALCNVSDGNIGINFDTKAKEAVAKEVAALKESNCNKTIDTVIFSTPYLGVVNALRKELDANELDNRIAIYMPTGKYSFLGLKFFLKTRLLQGLLARGSSIMEVHKIVWDHDPDLLKSWRDDGWCVGIWGITPDEVDNYDADVYIVNEAPEFPDLAGFGSALGKDGEPKLTVYKDNSLIPYYLTIALAAFLSLCSLLLFAFAFRLKYNHGANTAKKNDTSTTPAGQQVDEEAPSRHDKNNSRPLRNHKYVALEPENDGLKEAQVW